MDPSVLERLGLRPVARPQGRERAERAVAARSLMYLFLVGALVAGAALAADLSPAVDHARIALRSEERRVGKECRSRWSPNHQQKTTSIFPVRLSGPSH